MTQEQLRGFNLDLMQAPVTGKQLELKFGEDLGFTSGKRWDKIVLLFVGPLKSDWKKMSAWFWMK